MPKKIGSGTYGCVYRPVIPCKYLRKYNTTEDDDVMKVMHVANASNEEEVSEVIRDIDPKNQYFLPLKGPKCSVDMSYLKDCQSYQDADVDEKNISVDILSHMVGKQWKNIYHIQKLI